MRAAGQQRTAVLPVLAMLAAALVAGCGTKRYRESADRDAAAVLARTGPQVPNMDPDFSIAPAGNVSLEALPVNGAAPEFLGPQGAMEVGARVLSLAAALDTAVRHGRAYQERKEQVYLSALSLTLARHRFTPLFSAGASQDWAEMRDPLAPGRQAGTGGKVGVDALIRDLGKLSSAFTVDFTRFLSGDPRSVISTQLGATLTRPLLRGGGFKADKEALTQAERDVLYAIRDFVRFRKDYSVQVASAYYGVLGDRDAARTAFQGLQSVRRTAERTRALARERRASQSDLGRIEQQLLSAESGWGGAVSAYRRSLDGFRLRIGLPVEAAVILDDRELAGLGLLHPDLAVEDAVRVALAARLDLRNLEDRLADAERQVELAADGFLPQLDLTLEGSMSSGERGRLALPEASRSQLGAGAKLDLPFDRTAERNAWRAAGIARDRAGRARDQLAAEIAGQVRDGLRALEQARSDHGIATGAVRLAERRVREQELLAELGRAKTQDQVDAQNDLLAARNQLTRALVAHTVARLRFWEDLGILFIKEDGQWEAHDERRQ